jgi:hypothetical protein
MRIPPLFGAISIVDNRGQNHVDLMCISLDTEMKTMPEESKIETPPTQEESHTSKTGQEKRIDRIADQVAEGAGKAEKRYDQSHDIFTK